LPLSGCANALNVVLYKPLWFCQKRPARGVTMSRRFDIR
jgi:hypothetical protein